MIYKTIRGGSWFNSARNCLASLRFNNEPGNRSGNLGFRLIKKVKS